MNQLSYLNQKQLPENSTAAPKPPQMVKTGNKKRTNSQLGYAVHEMQYENNSPKDSPKNTIMMLH